MKKNILFCISISISISAYAQSNTAVTSGSIGKCAVWDYPYTLYNTVAASQTVNNGVTVTVDQDRNIGAVNFAGTGAMDLSGSGGEINCRWDLPFSQAGTATNNLSCAATSPVFTAPYSGNYTWMRSDGWNAVLSGAYLSGSLNISVSRTTTWSEIDTRNEAGTCGSTGAAVAASWISAVRLSLNPGDMLNYTAVCAYSTAGSCNDTQMQYRFGNASLICNN